jgi:glutathione synthase/RimK-type ligase-like ATP-grasp enzyme
MKKVALISWSKQEEIIVRQQYSHHPVLKSWLEEQSKFTAADSRIILPEDRLLIAELNKKGILAETVSWMDENVNWSDYHLCIVRSVWFWHHNPEKFFDFAGQIEADIPVWNSCELMRWGANKKYLVELAEKNVAVIPTVFVPANTAITLENIVRDTQWIDIVIKPSVSLGARDITRASINNKFNFKTLEQAESIFQKLIMTQDVVVQLCLNSIETEGEVSVSIINNKVTHAVRRLPAANDFLAIGYPLTKEEPYTVTPELMQLVTDMLGKIDKNIHFGRLDLIKSSEGDFLLSEIELISPRLFLQYSETALNYWAQIILEAVDMS